MNWTVGAVAITPVIELDLVVDPEFTLLDATPENLAPDFDWLQPYFVSEDGRLIFRVQALLVESCDQKIIIDTCVGNDKARGEPAFNRLDGAFINDISKAGFDREDVDLVVCTHLHYDHIGWNTMWVDGEWVPTFPNARYLMAQPEFDYCQVQEQEFWVTAFGDSVAPIFQAGLVDLVDCNHQITPEIKLFPTPGHTPGHCSVAISSQGETAMITGDVMHHPCQCAHPEWECVADTDHAQARHTRQEFLARVGNSETAVIGTHWASPRPVYVVRRGTAWQVEVRDGK